MIVFLIAVILPLLVALAVLVCAVKQADDGREDESGFHRAAAGSPLRPEIRAGNPVYSWPEIDAVAKEFGEGL